MGREHVEFVQAQALPWEEQWPYPEGATVKILSRDTGTGAASTIIRYPAGWSAPAGALGAAEELFVLDGELTLGDRTYRQDCYAYLPAGHARAPAAAENGAVVLTFFDREPEWLGAAASESDPSTDEASSDAIPFLDAFEVPWECGEMDPAYADVGLRWKILRFDAARNDCSMLIMTPPHMHPSDWRGPQEVHDCVEEMFLISGDFLSNVGLMCDGAYFWRPPGIAHGPYGSRAGNLTFIRTLGNPLENNWTDYEVSIDREPELKPFIPDAVRPRLEAGWSRPARY
ncbi:MAG: cupin domain-containing protein [Gammaproteobacteria bacterium]|nr:cupin domain-containing protein [Gammaproteobacteria bacterium]